MSVNVNNTYYINNSKKIENVSKRNLAKVIVDFINLQTKQVRAEIAKELCDVKIDRTVCNYFSSRPSHYDISAGIYHDKLSFNDFLTIIERVQNRLRIKCKGFSDVVQNYKSLPENSNDRKSNKYKGMINCCIVKGNCSDSRKIKNSFLGIPLGRRSSTDVCVVSGGTRKKRRAGRTRKYRR